MPLCNNGVIRPPPKCSQLVLRGGHYMDNAGLIVSPTVKFFVPLCPSVQGLCQCISSGLVDNLSGSWVHEVRRAFCDGICRNKDSDWLHMYAQSLGEEKVNITITCRVDLTILWWS